MTRKDYLRAVDVIKDMRRGAYGNEDAKYHEITGAITAFVWLFRGDNPRFSEDRFREACSE